jgi:hypothetical protein
VKLTGSTRRLQFGTLTALDDVPEELEEGVVGHDRLFNIGRLQNSLSPGSYVGAIVTDMEAGADFNRVAGGDLSLRVGNAQRVTGMLLLSRSPVPDGAPRTGVAASASWGYNSRRQGFAAFVEHYDRDFRMDTAFYNRVNITAGWGYTERNFYPDEKKHGWIKRVSPFVFVQQTEDRTAGGDERVIVPGVRMSFTRQGFLRLDVIAGHERWLGEKYEMQRPRVMGEVQLFRWMRLSARLDAGPAVYYDPVEPFAGWSRSISVGGSWQPTPRLSQSVGYQRVDFRRADNRAPVYDLDLVNTNTTFQFSKQFFLRAILQYDSLQARVLTDLLASYELRPGTVAFAGYGSLLERRDFVDGEWVTARGDYLATRRGFFLKGSYLYRF